MSLSREVRDWLERLQALMDEGRELSCRLDELESQNAVLQERLLKAGIKSEGINALKNLYNEGFHICHAHFAEKRDEECLFCLSFLHREGIDTSREL